MPNSTPQRPNADRNLFFGILALQMDFITRDALIAAMNAWVLDKAKSLGQILSEHDELKPPDRDLLKVLVNRHLQMHVEKVQKNLAASARLVQQEIEKIGDADLKGSLALVLGKDGANDDPNITRQVAAGQPSSLGLRFRILREHAKGGLGAVFVARDEELCREVALKEIQEKDAHREESQRRFVLEAEVTGKLEHPGIVPVYGLGRYPDGRPFYAMRFIRGDSLHEAIRRFYAADEKKRDSGERSLAFRGLLGDLVAACNAVAYAHSRGVLHRDIKPHNIMLGKYGETLVVDWGLAKLMNDHDGLSKPEEGVVHLSVSDTSTPTQAGHVMGTPPYMSPEQAEGRMDLLNAPSDIYSLGATLYELLTGKAPIEGFNIGEMLARVKRGDWPSPRKVRKDVPAPLDAICRKAMALRPQDRYTTALELAEDIKHWLADEPVSAHREPWRVRLRRWLRRHQVVAAAAAGLLITAVVALTVGIIVVRREKNYTEEARQAVSLEQHRTEVKLIRDSPRLDGWRDMASNKFDEADRRRNEIVVKSDLVTTLAGLDATLLAHLDYGPFTILFDRDKRLLMSPPFGSRNQLTKLWNPTTGDIQALPCIKGVGPVGFRQDRTPIQLVIHQEGGLIDQPEVQLGGTIAYAHFGPLHLLAFWGVESEPECLQVWDLAKNRLMSECRLPVPPNEANDWEFVKSDAVGIGTLMTADGARVAAAARGPQEKASVTVWDGVTARVLATFDKAAGPLAFTPDNKYLAAADREGEVTIWPIDQSGETVTFHASRLSINCLVFSPDNRVLAVGDSGGMVTLWDWQRRRHLLSCPGSAYKVLALAFNPDGTLMASGGRGSTRIWDTSSGKLLLELKSGDFLTGLAFTSDGQQLAVSGMGLYSSPSVDVWKLEYGRGIQTLRGLLGPIVRVEVSPNGRYLAALTHNWQIGIFDLAKNGQRRWLLDVPPGEFVDNPDMVFNPQGDLLAFSGHTQAVLWDLKTGESKQRWILPPGLQDALAFHPSGALLLFRNETEQGTLPPFSQVDWREFPRVCRLRTLVGPGRNWKPTQSFPSLAGSTLGLIGSPLGPGPFSAVANMIPEGVPNPVISEFNVGVPRILAESDGNYFIAEGMHSGSDGQSRTICAFDGLSGQELWRKPSKKKLGDGSCSISVMDLSRRWLCMDLGTSGAKQVLVDWATGKEMEHLEEGLISMTPRGYYRLVIHREDKDRLGPWALVQSGSEQPLIVLAPEPDLRSCTSPSFHPDGTRLIWGHSDGTVTVCDVEQMRQQLNRRELGWQSPSGGVK